jgi:hypothetical protein
LIAKSAWRGGATFTVNCVRGYGASRPTPLDSLRAAGAREQAGRHWLVPVGLFELTVASDGDLG